MASVLVSDRQKTDKVIQGQTEIKGELQKAYATPMGKKGSSSDGWEGKSWGPGATWWEIIPFKYFKECPCSASWDSASWGMGLSGSSSLWLGGETPGTHWSRTSDESLWRGLQSLMGQSPLQPLVSVQPLLLPWPFTVSDILSVALEPTTVKTEIGTK